VKAKSRKQKVEKKKHASGYAGRVARRKRLAELTGVAVNLIKMPYVGRIATVSDWHVQVARIYRRMLTGEIPEYVGTKLVYVATAGASLAKIMAELRENENMRIAFERAVEAGLINRDTLPPTFNGGEYLPANKEDDEDEDPMIRRKPFTSKGRQAND
jgi:hypothetical protein